MLLNFGAKNFYSFKEGVDISLELGAKCPKDISKGKHVSNLLCIKGANATGKTNILKILSFLNDFCCDSFNQKPNEEILILSHFQNSKPINIYCEFLIDNTRYLYETSLTPQEILSEKLTRKKKRAIILFERKKNRIVSYLKEYEFIKKMTMRKNASVISTANQYNPRGIRQIYNFFNNIKSNVGFTGYFEIKFDLSKLALFYKNNPKILSKSIDFIKKMDMGISDIKIEKRNDETGEEIYFPLFFHNTESKSRMLTFYDQSAGTKHLYKILPYYFIAILNGSVLALDEFEKDLHPHILPEIVKLFELPEINTKNAQLIFCTHNTEIIDYLGKYRTFIVNKDECESFGYRLDEIKGELLRNDRPLSPLYDKGKLGGVPEIS